MRRKFVAITIAILGTLLGAGPAAAQFPGAPAPRSHRVILSLGNDQFLPKSTAEALTGARFQSDFSGLRYLDDVSVIVLADIPYAQLPPVLQASLLEWVNLGGSLLVTGGNGAFGLGGYAGTPISTILPLRPATTDNTSHGFSPTYVLNPGHPIFTSVTTATMANFNETSVASDAALLLEYRGVSKGGFAGGGLTGSGKPFGTVGAGIPGGVGQGGIPNTAIATINTEGGIQGGGRATFPLMAERRQGKGTVLAIALDMNATGDWQDRGTLMTNAIRYLLEQSTLPNR